MPCPACDHTMSKVDDHSFLCPRCGTLIVTTERMGRVNVFVPALVERCREFEKSLDRLPPYTGVETAWHRLGIAESIRPEDRPNKE